MRYSKGFERDFKWYMSVRHTFNFDGCDKYYNKRGVEIIQYDPNGVSGKEAFYKWDSGGLIVPTKHPNLLHTLLKVKGSINLHIKMLAEDRAQCNINRLELRLFCMHFKSPSWFRQAVEMQRMKYW